jgi:hypothetical protein
MTFYNYFIGYKLPEGAMDSAYLFLLFGGGLLAVVIFLIFYIISIKNIDFMANIPYLSFVIACLFSGFAETTFSTFNTISCIFWIILYQSILK